MSIRRIAEWIGGVNEPCQVRLKLKGLGPRKKAKSVVIATEVTPPRATRHKPPQGSLKGKGKKHVVARSNSTKTYIEVSLASSTDIQRIEAKYTKDKVERRRKALVDTSSVVDVEAMEDSATQSTPTNKPSGIPNSSTSTAHSPVSHPPLTQAMIFKMGNLAYSFDVRVARVEAT
ncbi:hypothetical protein H5410_046655, partial [Solanum commersonii]